jgi:tRNA dimethylallyltransferase
MSKIIVIAGPTASMKSSLAMEIAAKLPSEIINADAMQIYKNAPILSAQPSQQDQQNVTHKLYGFADDDITYDVSSWIYAAKENIDNCIKNNKTPILVGGTGMYIASLIRGLADIPEISVETKEEAQNIFTSLGNEDFFYKLAELDPEICQKLHVQDSQRILRAYEVVKQTGKSILWWQSQGNKQFYDMKKFIYIVTNPDRENLYSYCDQRFENMLESGAIYEANKLYIKYKNNSQLPIMRILGLKEIIEYLAGNISLEAATLSAKMTTRRYAKRQITWFKNQLPEINKMFYNHNNDSQILINQILKEL